MHKFDGERDSHISALYTVKLQLCWQFQRTVTEEKRLSEGNKDNEYYFRSIDSDIKDHMTSSYTGDV